MKKTSFASSRGKRATRSEQHQKSIPHRFMIYGTLGLLFAGLAGTSFMSSQVNASDGDDPVEEYNGIGRYDLTVAGNNNVYRGDDYESRGSTGRLVAPDDNSVKPNN